jgi:hypothetical protein
MVDKTREMVEMAKTNARKKREHTLRNGGYVGMRGSWFGVNPITKTTPTIQKKKEKERKKHKSDLQRDCS